MTFEEKLEQSSLIKGIEYEYASRSLVITFKSGNKPRWRYKKFPESEFERFKAADSLGKFFHAEIKGKIDEKGEPLYPAEAVI